MAAILGMGNPLLDISAEVDQALLDKYELLPGNAILAEEKHQPLFPELSAKPNVKFIAGGATQNSIRVAQWMLQEPGRTAYIGCVGSDDFSKRMTEACAKDGVKTAYKVDAATPTGTCAVCVVGIERSLCTNLNAANNYTDDHLKQAENWKLVEEAKIIYSAGFFITVSPQSMKLAAEETVRKGSLYCLNLAAPFIMQVPPFKATCNELLPYVDFLFGNETEFQTWADVEGWDTQDLAFIATRLSLVRSEKSRKRTVVVTQGVKPTLVAINGHVTEYPVIALPKESLVDTNGAGDAYVGGFLAALSKGLDMAQCTRAGAHSASLVVQQSGCTYPETPGYSW